MEFKWLEINMFKDHYKSLRGESRKLKSVESWMKYVGSKLFPRLVVTFGVRQRSEMILTLTTPSMNNSWYHEPPLVKFEIRVNHNLEPRRPIKIYKELDQKPWNEHIKCV
jgi:hypothetical protein